MSFTIDQWNHDFKTTIQKRIKHIMKNETYKHMTPLSKNACIDKLYDIIKIISLTVRLIEKHMIDLYII